MRNRTKLLITAMTFLPSLFMSNNASAAAPIACGKIAGKCVSEPTIARSSCFQRFASNRTCSRLPLGRIVAKRIKYAPQSRKTSRTRRAPNGAKSVEPLCLDYFDIQLRNAIDFGPINAEREKALKAQLNRCGARTPLPAPMTVSFDTTKSSGQ